MDAEPGTFRFFAAGLPKGQPRPRAFSRGGHARVFDPGTAEGWKSAVALAARGNVPAAPLSGPVQLTVELLFPRPKLHLKKGALREGAPEFHTSKPDADNAAKAVMDALTVLGVWGDDAQVAALITTKRYAGTAADPNERPGAWITIRALTEDAA